MYSDTYDSHWVGVTHSFVLFKIFGWTWMTTLRSLEYTCRLLTNLSPSFLGIKVERTNTCVILSTSILPQGVLLSVIHHADIRLLTSHSNLEIKGYRCHHTWTEMKRIPRIGPNKTPNRKKYFTLYKYSPGMAPVPVTAYCWHWFEPKMSRHDRRSSFSGTVELQTWMMPHSFHNVNCPRPGNSRLPRLVSPLAQVNEDLLRKSAQLSVDVHARAFFRGAHILRSFCVMRHRSRKREVCRAPSDEFTSKFSRQEGWRSNRCL